MNKNAYNDAFRMALKVEFFADKEELFLYAGALYAAMMWGMEVDRENEEIRERDKSVK